MMLSGKQEDDFKLANDSYKKDNNGPRSFNYSPVPFTNQATPQSVESPKKKDNSKNSWDEAKSILLGVGVASIAGLFGYAVRSCSTPVSHIPKFK